MYSTVAPQLYHQYLAWFTLNCHTYTHRQWKSVSVRVWGNWCSLYYVDAVLAVMPLQILMGFSASYRGIYSTNEKTKMWCAQYCNRHVIWLIRNRNVVKYFFAENEEIWKCLLNNNKRKLCCSCMHDLIIPQAYTYSMPKYNGEARIRVTLLRLALIAVTHCDS